MKMKSRLLPVGVAVMAVLGVTACAPGASTGGDEPSAEPIVLRIAEFEAEGSTRAAIHQEWADRIAERTDGQVQVEFFWSSSLLTQPDMVSGVAGGVADGGTLGTSFDPTAVPLAVIPGGPGLYDDWEVGLRSTHEYLKTYEPVQAQLDEANLVYLYPYAHPSDTYLGTKVPINNMADMQGLQSRALGGLWAQVFTEAGLEMVSLPASETYTAMERGTVDGIMSWFIPFLDFRWYEQTDYLTPMSTGTTASLMVVMNKDQFDGLPADIQDIILEVSDEMVDETIAINNVKFEEAHKAITDAGVTVPDAPPGDIAAAMRVILDKAYPPFLATIDGGEEAMEALQAIVAKQK